MPETLDWYRQSANWLVGLASGALAISASLAEKLLSQGSIAKTLFIIEGLAFLVTVLSGVIFHFSLLSYGASREFMYSETDPEAKKTYQKNIDNAGFWYPKLYYSMTVSFAAGALFLALLGLAAMLPTKQSAEKTELIVLLTGEKSLAISAESQILLVENKSGEVWEVKKEVSSGWSIRKVERLDTGSARSPSASSGQSSAPNTASTPRRRP